MVVASNGQKIRVLVIDDHPMTLRGVKDFLGTKDHIDVIGEAYNGKDGVCLAKALSPDIVLMDISMPEMDGLKATQVLKKEAPNVKVVFLTMHDSKYYFEEFLSSGARGYVMKNDSPEKLLLAIEAVYDGKAYFNSVHSKILLEEYENDKISPASKLTSRETSILILVAKGLTNKQIADKLNSNSRTVEKHRNKIMDKLNLHSAVDLTRYAIARKLVEAEE